nr:dicentracin-like [Maylandia zebra]
MKCTILFLVLSMVVLMAEPGEGFISHIIGGIIHAGKAIHSADKRRRQRGELQVEQELQQELQQQLQQLKQLQQQEKLNQRFNREQLKRERVVFN